MTPPSRSCHFDQGPLGRAEKSLTSTLPSPAGCFLSMDGLLKKKFNPCTATSVADFLMYFKIVKKKYFCFLTRCDEFFYIIVAQNFV
jgi:hypothetical protein